MDIDTELVTPTGAAIYGEIEKENNDVVVMETNIDDCPGELQGNKR